MVQLFLSRERRYRLVKALTAAGIALLLSPLSASPNTRREKPAPEQWEMSLEGGRKLTFERSFRSESDVRAVRGLWTKVVDFVAGEPDNRCVAAERLAAGDDPANDDD